MNKPAKPYRPGWIWKFYACYWTFLTVRAFYETASPDQPVYIFYHILIAFDPFLAVLYYSAAAGTVLNLLSLAPLWAFVLHRKIFNEEFWKPLFVLRVTFDLTGHYFEYVSLKSFFYADMWLGIQIVAGAILMLVPAYAACYQYAFECKKMFQEEDGPSSLTTRE